MPLPDVIEIVPLDRPVQAQITVPGSKSITNRALILAALADGETRLPGALWSEDTQVMVEALRRLGFEIEIEPDPEELCNRVITVRGLGGKIRSGGTESKPFDLFVGNAGTAARFLAPLVCLGNGVYRLDGTPRMRERPQRALFDALRQLGYHVDSANDRLPAVLHGTGPRAAECRVSIEQSSQFASGLLLCAPAGQWRVKISGENAEESPYVTMTSELVKGFPRHGGMFEIEPDASSGSYFLAANLLAEAPESIEYSEAFKAKVRTSSLSPISVAHWPASGWQIDQRFPRVLERIDTLQLGILLAGKPQFASSAQKLLQSLPKMERISRTTDLGDSIMTAIVLAPFALQAVQFTELGRLRLQECERVAALRSELTKCGAKVAEHGDTLEVLPSELHGAEIETYDDHRMAMCFAVLGLKVAGMRIRNPACVKKTFPDFFQKLAAPPPHGLGSAILDAASGRKLGSEELFVE